MGNILAGLVPAGGLTVMTDMDLQPSDRRIIDKLADFAQDKNKYYLSKAKAAEQASKDGSVFDRLIQDRRREDAEGMAMYWQGFSNALRAVSSGLGLRGLVEDEMDEEGSCP